MDAFWSGNLGDSGLLSSHGLDQFACLNSASSNATGGDMLPVVMPSHYTGTEEHSSNEKAPDSSAFLKLSNLNYKIRSCAARLPSTYTAEQANRKSYARAHFVFDELFRLTADLIVTLRSMSTPACTRYNDYPLDPESLSSDAFITTTAPSDKGLSLVDAHLISSTIMPQQRPVVQVDEPTMLIIISCHSQLTEIYTAIFKKIEGCIEHSRAPQTEISWALILPQLQVGVVTLPQLQVDEERPIPSKATSSMYTTMVALLLSQLWEQLADVMHTEGESPFNVVPTPKPSMVEKMWEAVMERSDHLIQSIDKTMCLLRQ